jgi:hypothetical protein
MLVLDAFEQSQHTRFPRDYQTVEQARGPMRMQSRSSRHTQDGMMAVSGGRTELGAGSKQLPARLFGQALKIARHQRAQAVWRKLQKASAVAADTHAAFRGVDAAGERTHATRTRMIGHRWLPFLGTYPQLILQAKVQ